MGESNHPLQIIHHFESVRFSEAEETNGTSMFGYGRTVVQQIKQQKQSQRTTEFMISNPQRKESENPETSRSLVPVSIPVSIQMAQSDQQRLVSNSTQATPNAIEIHYNAIASSYRLIISPHRIASSPFRLPNLPSNQASLQTVAFPINTPPTGPTSTCPLTTLPSFPSSLAVGGLPISATTSRTRCRTLRRGFGAASLV